jgi:hypothetical protein
LTAIFDSCHSGSALDLPYIYSTQGVLKEPNLAKEAGQGLLGIVSSYARGDLGGMASTAMGFFKKATSGNDIHERNLRTKTSPADVVMWSGSKDDQTSYVDTHFPTAPGFSFCDFGLLPSTLESHGCSEALLTPRAKFENDLPFHGVFMPHKDMAGNILV